MNCDRYGGFGYLQDPHGYVYPDYNSTGTKPEPEHTSICCNVGEHKCDLIMDLPDHMSDHREAREKAGLSPQICIDKCLENDIKRLWMLGYRTVNSCCGHGKTNSTVIIEFERMQNGKTI